MPAINVEFTVIVYELLQKNETIFVCGSVEELGNWYPMKAKALKRQERSKIKNIEIWSIELMLPLADIKYRYFLATYDDNHESIDEKNLNISTWESNIKPRCKSILEQISNGVENNQLPYDKYGYIDDHCRLLKGWLTDHTAVQIRLYGDCFNFYKTRDKSKRIFLNCFYFQMQKCHWNNDDYDYEPLNNVHRQVAKFSKLTNLNYTPSWPPPQGVEFCGEYLIFYIETMDLEDLWVEIEVRQTHGTIMNGFVSNSSNHEVDNISTTQSNFENGNFDEYSLVGTARLGLMSCEKTTKSISIFNTQNRPIGELKVEFIAIFPLMGMRYTMEDTYQLHWKHRKTLNVGHRGTGSSYGRATKVSAVRENTLFSLRTAYEHGADYVEFDVQLSKDMVPVLYHDFQVCTVLRKKRKNDLQYLEVPVKDLTLSDLHALKLDPTCFLSDDKREEQMNMEDIDPHELQAFPTLKSCLELVNIGLGFNIELKYPQILMNGQSEQSNYYDRNVYVDTILKVISKYTGRRRLILSCFDADVCLMCSLKQNKYPVFYLTQGSTDHFEQYKDIRTHSLENAMYFAKTANILGLSAYSSIMYSQLDIIQEIVNMKLILFVWGDDNNNTEERERWRDLGVHGIIFDRIHEVHQHGALNVFHIQAMESTYTSTVSDVVS